MPVDPHALRQAAERFVPGGNSNAVNELRDLAVAAADEIVRLKLALEEAGDFACFAPPADDPCECCLHVTDLVNATLGTPRSSGRTNRPGGAV